MIDITRLLFYPCLFVLGLIVGSFLNVCIWRIPRGESIVLPASHCPKCQNSLRFYDNIPVFSFILLKGRCRVCKQEISWQYPLVEALTCILFLTVGWRFGPSWPLIPYLFFTAALIVIAIIDLKHLIIPDVISLPGILIGFLVSFLPFMSREYFLRIPFENVLMDFINRFIPFMSVRSLDSLIGIIACGACFFLIAVVSELILRREALGFGDIKLISMIGAFLGWQGGLVTIFWASLIGSIWGGFLILIKKKSRKDVIPFGPFLCLGAFICLLFGPEMILWYQNLFRS